MIILSNEYISNAIVSDRHACGGPAIFAKNFSKYLIKRGHGWLGIAMRTEKIPTPRIKKISGFGRARYWRLAFPEKLFKAVTLAKRKGSPEIILTPIINRLAALIEKCRPDVLFLNGFSLFAWTLMKAAGRAGVPIAIQHAGIFTKEVKIYKHLFSATGRKILYQMEKDIAAGVQHEIFLNEFSRKVYKREVGKINAKKSSIIALPYFDFKTAVLPKQKKSAGHLKIGVVARWDKIKNHEAVLALAKKIEELGLPWRIHSVTKIPLTRFISGFKKEYRRYVKVEPPRSAEALKNFYRAMDIVIVPSKFDVSPNVVMEAVLAGVKVLISPNVGWMSEFKKSGCDNGIIDFSDPGIVVKRIKKIAGQPPCSRLVKAIRKNHKPNKIFLSYLKIFNSIKKR